MYIFYDGIQYGLVNINFILFNPFGELKYFEYLPCTFSPLLLIKQIILMTF